MSEDAELNQWRLEWQSQQIVTPEVSPVTTTREAGEMARNHTEFLNDAIRRLRCQFWRRSERNFLDALWRELRNENVPLRGWRMRRRRKLKGGLNV
jgi:hypothetical protein